MLKKIIFSLAFVFCSTLFSLNSKNIQTLTEDLSHAPILLTNSEGNVFISWLKRTDDLDIIQISHKNQNGILEKPLTLLETDKKICSLHGSFDYKGFPIVYWDYQPEIYKETQKKKFYVKKSPDNTWSLPKEMIFELPFSSYKISKKVLIPLFISKEDLAKEGVNLGNISDLPSEMFDIFENSFDGSFPIKSYVIGSVSHHFPESTTRLTGYQLENLIVKTEEVIYSTNSYQTFSVLSFAMNPKNQAALILKEHEDKSCHILTRNHGIWSLPFLITTKEPKASQHQIAVDDEGNIMAVWVEKKNKIYSLQACYKPCNYDWQTPLTIFTLPNNQVISSFQLLSNHKKHFVVLWNQAALRSATIFGSSFSIQECHWSSPTLLSPSDQKICLLLSATFSKKTGDGIFVWKNCRSDFTKTLEVSDLIVENP